MNVVPIGHGEKRLPQAGRIRIGIKGGPQGRKAINTFRFTSQKSEFLDAVAKAYGGRVKPFSDDKSPDSYEVISEAKEIKVILPPNPLSENYELWSGRTGLERRCNGVTCELTQRTGPESVEIIEKPCLCGQNGVLKCKYLLRLSVMLPEVETIGIWRLDTSSENARAEIPGVVELITMAQGAGLYRARLRLEQRTVPGHRFNVPVLDAGVGAEGLAAGAHRLGALEQQRSLGPYTPDDEVVEGEIVTEDDITGECPVDPMIARAWIDTLNGAQKARVLNRARAIAREADQPEPVNVAGIPVAIIDQLMKETISP